ncbi:hypothetical protein OOT00_08985 [Desulfobotulus sp. H1]|uniref:Uncharacterized protein n=1 Tax=Desulfobotulus pelophilus TaxID=2823377 RepID=A0ABT3N9I1_9BACT|nr:hypothetical protein [Desulfobotulus pelophilus]MCW7754121.1 hypothetical protein [Desulfobotulus pelophilus]
MEEHKKTDPRRISPCAIGSGIFPEKVPNSPVAAQTSEKPWHQFAAASA